MKLLENSSIRLRAPEPEDLETFYRWENDTSMWLLGITTTPFSRYTLKQYLVESKQDIYIDKQLRLMIEVKNTTETVGTVDIYDFNPFHKRAGVGILIDNHFRKKGYAFQTLLLLEEYVFDFFNLHQLYAIIAENNEASLNLFTKAEYVQTGKLRDWILSGNSFQDAFLFQKSNK